MMVTTGPARALLALVALSQLTNALPSHYECRIQITRPSPKLPQPDSLKPSIARIHSSCIETIQMPPLPFEQEALGTGDDGFIHRLSAFPEVKMPSSATTRPEHEYQTAEPNAWREHIAFPPVPPSPPGDLEHPSALKQDAMASVRNANVRKQERTGGERSMLGVLRSLAPSRMLQGVEGYTTFTLAVAAEQKQSSVEHACNKIQDVVDMSPVSILFWAGVVLLLCSCLYDSYMSWERNLIRGDDCREDGATTVEAHGGWDRKEKALALELE